MRWKILTATLPAVALLTFVGVAHGQISQPTSNFGTGNSNSNIGNSITPSASAFSNATQVTPQSLTSGTSGGTTGSGLESGTGGTSTGAVNSAAQQMQQNNAVNPFGASATGGAASSTNRNSAMNQFARGMSSMFGNQAFGQNFGNTGEQKQIPTKMVVKFRHPTINSAVVGRSLRRSLPWPNVSVAMDGSVATLTGSVESEDLKTVAERFVKMEPGVAEVKNELQVEPQPLRQ
ncbi:BON domain protein [Blastopirellula retiformator]|uniref:BON domain protein n=1 Tax=Blastopirellula retiformator TaxID=2527970 RepID=A0A5C5VA42_9BACT|nr:BON domain protein [Blastopirellula retiformator]